MQIETSLGLTNRVRLLRHLALRFGSDDDFLEVRLLDVACLTLEQWHAQAQMTKLQPMASPAIHA